MLSGSTGWISWERQRRGNLADLAAIYPERIRSLTLTDCDTHDNWPPEAFKPFLRWQPSGGLRERSMDAADKSVYRSPQLWVLHTSTPNGERTKTSKRISGRS